ncbi:hypothetical protein DFH27DRAFT_607710 [Peziza echinospora]|nr:hypothetical protein DFH27DRAFT_607710 [Peziza echinospora]
MVERPSTPASAATSFRSVPGSPVARGKTMASGRIAPVTPTRSPKRVLLEEVDQNDSLMVPKNTRRPNPSTASATLRLSTASLGAVRRVGTPNSSTTGAVSYYSADDDTRNGSGQQLDNAFEAGTEEEYFGSVVGNYEDSLSVRRESFDTTMYEASSAPSSPQRGNDYPVYLNHLSPPPPRGISALQTPSLNSSPKPAQVPATPPPVNKTPLPRSLGSALQSGSPASSLLRPSRARYCTYVSIHTGARCNSPTSQTQNLCPVHLHQVNLPSNTRSSMDQQRRTRRDEIAKAFLGNEPWAPHTASDGSPRNNSPWQTPYTRSPARYSSDEDLSREVLSGDRVLGDGSVLPAHLFSCHSNASSRNDDGYPVLPGLDHSGTLPSTARSGSASAHTGADTMGYPFSHVDHDPILAANTVIDWKSNESRRREYEEADRRRKGLWGWVRRRIRSLCCVKAEQGEFFEGNKDDDKGDGGSVRRYRLVLPEERGMREERRGRDKTIGSAPPTAGGGNGAGKSGRIESVIRRASVAGDAGLNNLARNIGYIPMLGGKEVGLPAINVLEKVDSYGSSGSDGHAYQVHYHQSYESHQAAVARDAARNSFRKEKLGGSEGGGVWRRRRRSATIEV